MGILLKKFLKGGENIFATWSRLLWVGLFGFSVTNRRALDGGEHPNYTFKVKEIPQSKVAPLEMSLNDNILLLSIGNWHVITPSPLAHVWALL